MKARFCPGYHVARTCGARYATCKHVVVRDLPPGLHSPRRRGQLLPVFGWGVLEELKMTDTKRHFVSVSGVGSLVHPHGRLTLN